MAAEFHKDLLAVLHQWRHNPIDDGFVADVILETFGMTRDTRDESGPSNATAERLHRHGGEYHGG